MTVWAAAPTPKSTTSNQTSAAAAASSDPNHRTPDPRLLPQQQTTTTKKASSNNNSNISNRSSRIKINKSQLPLRPKSSAWASSTTTVKWRRMGQQAPPVIMRRRPAQMTTILGWQEGSGELGGKGNNRRKGGVGRVVVLRWRGATMVMLMSRMMWTHCHRKWAKRGTSVERICSTSHSSGNLTLISHKNGILRKKALPCNRC